MQFVRRFLIVFVLLFLMATGNSGTIVFAQATTPFLCGTGLYIAQRSPAQLYEINRTTDPYTLVPIGTPHTTYNAIGYNPVDNFIYGMNPDNYQFFRVDSTGATTNLGIPAGFPRRGRYLSGTFLEDGTYLVNNQGVNPQNLVSLDVTTTPPTVINAVTMTGTSIVDIAVNPLDGLVYAYELNADQMVTLDPTTGAVNRYGFDYPPAQGVVTGSSFFDSMGNLFLYGSAFGGGAQNRFYSVDLATGILTQVSTGPAVTIVDGTSCISGIQMQKTVAPSPAIAGSIVTYTYRISNQSDITLNGIDFDDMMDSGRTFVAGTLASAFGGTPNAYGGTNTLTITDMTLPANTINTITVDVQLPSNAPASTVFNQANLTDIPPAFAPTVQSDYPVTQGGFPDATPLEIIRSADLSITKTHTPEPAIPGGFITFTLVVDNAGPNDVANASVTDTFPTELNNITWTCALTAGTGNCDDANGTGNINTTVDLDSGAQATFTISAQLLPTVSAGFSNTATVIAPADTPDPDDPNRTGAGNNSSTDPVTVQLQSDLTLGKAVNNPDPSVGDNITYTISITNDGPSNATGVQVSEPLSANLTYVSDNPSQGTYNSGTGIWDIGNIASGATHTLQITVTVDVLPVTNTAQVSASDQLDPDSTPDNGNANEDDQASVSLPQGNADLSLQKTASTQFVQVGNNVTFTLALSNAGPNTATNVIVNDQLPAGLTYVSDVPDQGTYDSVTGDWDIGTITAGTTLNLQITATVNLNNAYTNTAEVSRMNEFDPDSMPNNNIETEDDQDTVTLLIRPPVNPNPSTGGSSSSSSGNGQDFGDAIDSFRTTLGADGARHTIVDGLHFGETIDAEPDGQPSEFALNDGADEDGVIFPLIFPGQTAQVTITATNSGNSDAYINAWVDLNSNFQFEASDRVAQDLRVPAGTTNGRFMIPVPIPANLPANVSVYARFRLSTQPGLDYSGAAPDGEVEDYDPTLQIVQTLPETGETFPWYTRLTSLLLTSITVAGASLYLMVRIKRKRSTGV